MFRIIMNFALKIHIILQNIVLIIMDPQQKQSSTSKPNDYILRTEQLPQTDEPSSDNLVKFFKTKHKRNQNYFNIQIGLLVVQYKQFQQDFVTYLANSLMCQAQFLNVFIVDPNHLYIAMNSTAQIGETQGFDYLELQSDIYYLLEFSRKVIQQFFQKCLSQEAIFGSQSEMDFQRILSQFQKICIKPINQMHQKIFDRNN